MSTKKERAVRNREIYEACQDVATFQELSDRFGKSRQRMQQICKNYVPGQAPGLYQACVTISGVEVCCGYFRKESNAILAVDLVTSALKTLERLRDQ